ncbi:MAG: hypothetical protein ACI4WH_01585 [Oscillospiraceae bacterium]
MVVPSYASENVLKFHEDNSKLYYDATLYDTSIFLNCENMSFNEEYIQSMRIENLTNTSYRLYLKAIPVEQSKLCDELLNSINISISLDGKVIYHGKASGKTYDENYPEMTNALDLGEFKAHSSSELSATVSLDNNYSIIEETSCEIDWKFYAMDNSIISDNTINTDRKIIPIEESLPFKTNDDFNPFIVLVGIVSIICMVGNGIYLVKNLPR